MIRPKVQNQSPKSGLIFPLIRNCKIHRLTTKESLEYCHKNNWKCSKSSFFEWKNNYEQDSGNRFIEMARCEWADEHLLVIDKYKEIERQYWKLFDEAETTREGKNILDSLRALQENILLIYNETPMIQKMKETLDSRVQQIPLVN
jgi:hypothetical protein